MSTDETAATYSVTCGCGKRHTFKNRDRAIECDGCGLRVTGFPTVSDRIEDLPDYLTTIRKNTDADGRFWPFGIGVEWQPRSEIPPPSQGGPPFTLAEIDESIRLMEQRLESGQGTPASAMCRLSLDATKALRGMVEDAQSDVDRRSAAPGRIQQENRELRAEIDRLLQRIWDEHQDGEHPCTCHDCRTYARNSGLWVEVTDSGGRVVDFKAAAGD